MKPVRAIATGLSRTLGNKVILGIKRAKRRKTGRKERGTGRTGPVIEARK